MEGKILAALDEHQFILDGHTDILDQHTKQLDFLAIASAQNESDIKYLRENMVTKQDHQEVMGVLDKIVGMFKKEKDESASRSFGMRRMDDKIEKNARDIAKIKPLVGLTS